MKLVLILPRRIGEESEKAGASIEVVALDALCRRMREGLTQLRGWSCM